MVWVLLCTVECVGVVVVVVCGVGVACRQVVVLVVVVVVVVVIDRVMVNRPPCFTDVIGVLLFCPRSTSPVLLQSRLQNAEISAVLLAPFGVQVLEVICQQRQACTHETTHL